MIRSDWQWKGRDETSECKEGMISEPEIGRDNLEGRCLKETQTTDELKTVLPTSGWVEGQMRWDGSFRCRSNLDCSETRLTLWVVRNTNKDCRCFRPFVCDKPRRYRTWRLQLEAESFLTFIVKSTSYSCFGESSGYYRCTSKFDKRKKKTEISFWTEWNTNSPLHLHSSKMLI